MRVDTSKMIWTRAPKEYNISDDVVTMTTEPHTDLWQRTYYHFRNDNAPCLQLATDEQYFSFRVKTSFDSSHKYEQCGVCVYLDSENWIKASIECENDKFQHIGVVVTNDGFSDWSTAEIPAIQKYMWYRLSRRGNDFKIEYSYDNEIFSQMRICHLKKASDGIKFGVYACSPEDSSFHATFTDMTMGECEWLAHDGQQPDKDIDY